MWSAIFEIHKKFTPYFKQFLRIFGIVSSKKREYHRAESKMRRRTYGYDRNFEERQRRAAASDRRLLLLSDGLSGCVAFLEGAAPQARKADALRRAHRRAKRGSRPALPAAKHPRAGLPRRAHRRLCGRGQLHRPHRRGRRGRRRAGLSPLRPHPHRQGLRPARAAGMDAQNGRAGPLGCVFDL